MSGAKAAIHAQPQKQFSVQASDENERWKWDETRYTAKNKDKDKNNHYDWSRRNLNFEIIGGKIFRLGSQTKRLHERLQERLDTLRFKGYKKNSSNNPNSCVDWIFSGDHDQMCKLAFGKYYKNIDFTANTDNTAAVRMTDMYRYNKGERIETVIPTILQWAKETYFFACRRWGKDNIIGAEVHLDETTPHMHLLMVPVAERKNRGRASTRYERIDDPSKTIKKKEYDSLSDLEKRQYRPVSKKSKATVSYSGVFGDNYAERKEYMKKLHTDYYKEIGWRYGLERGDDLDLLTPEERRQRKHLGKDKYHEVKEAEKTAKAKTQEVETAKTELANIKEDIRKAKVTLDTVTTRLQDLPSMEEVLHREQQFKEDKKRIFRMLQTAGETANDDMSVYKELTDIAQIKNDVEWYRTAVSFLHKRNNDIDDRLAKLKKEVDDEQKKLDKIVEDKKKMYSGLILPNGMDMRVTVNRNILSAKSGEVAKHVFLSESQAEDLKNETASKYQMGTLLLGKDLLNQTLINKQEQIAALHMPTAEEVETAKEKVADLKGEKWTLEAWKNTLNDTIKEKQKLIVAKEDTIKGLDNVISRKQKRVEDLNEKLNHIQTAVWMGRAGYNRLMDIISRAALDQRSISLNDAPVASLYLSSFDEKTRDNAIDFLIKMAKQKDGHLSHESYFDEIGKEMRKLMNVGLDEYVRQYKGDSERHGLHL